jgi:Acetoacetate decarboxylase (ADC)
MNYLQIAFAFAVAAVLGATHIHAQETRPMNASTSFATLGVRTEISPELLNNRADFDQPFFRKVSLRSAPQALNLGNGIARNYLFPTLYKDVTQAMAFFSADFETVSKALPSNSGLKPVSMGFGRAVVAIASYHYKTVLGIPGYREIAIAVPVVPAESFAPPFIPLLKSNWAGFGFFVLSMPVTSLENQLRGRLLWGLPKDLERIDIEVQGTNVTTKVYDSLGSLYLTTHVDTKASTQFMETSLDLYSTMGGHLLRSNTRGQGMQSIQKNPLAIWKFGSQDQGNLELGSGPKAQFLRDLNIHPVAFETRFSLDVSSYLDLAYEKTPLKEP